MNKASKLNVPPIPMLRYLMDENNIKRSELAQNIGVSTVAIGQYYNGETLPTMENLIKIADFFNVSTDYLLERAELSTRDPEVTKIHDYTGLSQEAIENLHFIHYFGDDKLINTINFLIENEAVDSHSWAIIDGEMTIMPDKSNKLNLLFQISEYFSTKIDSDIEVLIRRNGILLADDKTAWHEKLFKNASFLMKDVINTTLLQSLQENMEAAKEKFNAIQTSDADY